jgi:hypothetical protein
MAFRKAGSLMISSMFNSITSFMAPNWLANYFANLYEGINTLRS